MAYYVRAAGEGARNQFVADMRRMKSAVSRLSMLALEPRLVFDGAGAVTNDLSTHHDSAVSDVAHAISDADVSNVQSRDTSTSLAVSESLAPSTDRRELVVVDGSLEDLQALLESVKKDDASRNILVLEKGADEVSALTNYLQQHADTYDAIHIISHGSAGTISLGGQALDLGLVGQSEALWNGIRDSLRKGGDLLLYGCNIGESLEGRASVDLLARYTAADVAVSTDVSGGADGNWTLEYQTGVTETNSINISNYRHDLWVVPTSVTVPSPYTVSAPPGPTTGNQFYILDPTYGLMEGSWWGQDGGKANLTSRATYNNKSNAQANLTPLDLTFSDNLGGAGIRFTMVETNDGSVQASVDVNATSYDEALSNNEYFYSTMQVSANSAIALSNLRFTPVNSKLFVSAQDASLNSSNGGPLPAVNSALINTAAQMALVLYDNTSQTLTRLTPNALNVNASGGVAVNTPLDKVGLTPGGNYELRFYVWSLGGSTSTVYVDNPIVFASYNEAPTAVADTFSATGTGPVIGNLITANNGSGIDTDPENQTLSLQKINGSLFTVGSTINTTYGSVTITNTNGAFSYTANAGYSGTDSFNYTVVDAYGLTSTATATINVTVPLTVNDISVNEGSPYGVFSVGGANGRSLTLSLANNTASGTGGDYGALGTVTTIGQSNLEYSLDGGSTWLRYTGAFSSNLSGGGVASGLLVRTPIVNDTISDNGETFTLTATPSGASAVVGTATIYDDGTGQWFTGASGVGSNSAPVGQYLDGDMSLTVNNLVVNEGSPYAVWTVNYGAGKLVNLSLRDGASSQIQQAGVNGIANVASDLLTFAAGHQLETSVDGGASWSAYTAGNSVAMGSDSKLLVRARVNNDLPFEVSEILNLDVRGSSTTGTAFEISGTSSLAISGVTGAAALNASASTNLIQNGDFSQYTGNYYWAPLIANPGNITAWQESGGGPRSYGTVSNAEVYFGNQNGWSMYDGTNSYPIKYDSSLFDARGFTTGDFYFRDPGTDSAGRWVAGDYGNNANPPAIAQTIQTEVGSTYRLQFTQRSEYPASLDGIAAVSINGQRVYFKVVSATDQVYTLQFIANSSNTTIQFMSWGHIWGRDELVLDNVIVNKVPVTSGTLTILDNGQGAYYNGTSASPTSAALNDDRGNSPFVKDIFVNEASPYGVFSVSGMPDAAVDLSVAAGTASLASDVTSIDWSNDGGSSWNTNLSGATLDSSGSLLVRFSPVNDTVFEGSETFSLTATYSVAQPPGVVVTSGGSDIGLATISDNGTGQWFSSANPTGSDTAPSGMLLNDDRSISVNSISVNEASDYAVFTVTATAGQTVSMLSLNDGTASGKGIDYGSDLEQGGPPQYQLQYSLDNGVTWNTYSVDTYLRSSTTFTVPTSASYPAGTPGATFLVRSKLYNDSIFDNGETFSLTAVLSNGQSSTGVATIYDNGTGTIFTSTGGVDLVTAKNDDRGANPVVSDVLVNEGSPYAVFTVEGLPGALLQLDLIIATPASGKAINADLVASGSPSLQVFNGTTWLPYDAANKPAIAIDGKLFVRAAIANDSTNEGAETFSLKATYTGVGGGTANANDTGIATIVDDGTGTLFTAGNPTGGIAPTIAPATGNAVLAADAAALRNDDRPVTVTGFTVNEASPFGIFSISGAAGQYITLSVADGTAKIDANGSALTDGTEDYGPNLQYFDGSAWQSYTPGSYVQIPTNGTTLLVRTNIINDTIFEGSESLTLTAANTQGASTSGTGTITDDGTGSLFSANNATGTADLPGTNGAPTALNDDRMAKPLINSVTVNEASPYIIFTVRGVPQAGVDLALTSGTAIVGTDTASSSSLQVYRNGTWVPYTSANAIINSDGTLLVRLVVAPDSPPTFEGVETFGITATYNNSGTAAGITVGGMSNGVGTIRDDGLGSLFSASNITGSSESAGTNGLTFTLANQRPIFSVNDVTVNEASGTLSFTVTQSNSAKMTTTVDFATSDGTASSTDNDYTQVYGTLSFLPGETSKSITISVIDNNIFEGPESFNLDLSNASVAIIGDTLGIGTIRDDGTGSGGTSDDRPLFTVDDVTVNEGAGTMTFTVIRTGDATLNSTVAYTTASGTATSGTDFTATSGTLTFAPGETTKTITVPITNDTPFEGSETLTVTLRNPTNAQIWDGTGVGTILDDGKGTGGNDDDRPIKIADVCVNEGSPYAIWTIAAPAGQLVSLDLLNGTATVANDLSGTGSKLEYFDGNTWVPYNSGGFISVPPGGSSGELLVRVNINNDAVFENIETLQLKVSTAAPGSSATISGSSIGAGPSLQYVAGAPLMDRTDNNLIYNGDFEILGGLDPNKVYFWGVNTVQANARLQAGNHFVPYPGSPNGQAIPGWTAAGGGTYTYALWGNLTSSIGVTTGQPRSVYFGNGIAININPSFSWDTNGFSTQQNLTFTQNPSFGDASGVSLSQIINTDIGTQYRLQFRQLAEQSPDQINAGFAALEISGYNRTYFSVQRNVRTVTIEFTAVQASTNITFRSWGHIPMSYQTELGLDDVIVQRLTQLQDISTATLTIKDNGQGCSWFNSNNTTGLPDSPNAPLNNDSTANPFVNSIIVNEGSPYAVFTVQGLPGANVDLAIVEGTDAAGSTGADVSGLQWFDAANNQWLDYNSSSPAVVNADGTVLVRTTPVNDTVFETSETFNLTATYSAAQTVAGLTIGASATGVGTIKDDGTGQWFTGVSGAGSDSAPVGTRLNDDRTVSVNSITVNEASPYAVFTVTGTAGQYVSLALGNTASAADVDALIDTDTQDAGSAMPLQYFNGTAWVDYTPGSLVQMPTATLLVRTRVVNDTPYEDAETFTLVATNAGGLSATGTCTIRDDGTGSLFSANNTTGNAEAAGTNGLAASLNDDRPITVSNLLLNEATGNAVFTISGTAGQVVNSLVLAAGTATSGTDYGTSLSYSIDGGTNWLSFTQGTTNITIPVAGSFLVRNSITNDAPYEGAETYTLTATPRGGNAVIGTATIYDDGSGTGGTNDDRAANPSVNDVTVNEGSPYAVFTVQGLPGAGMTLSLSNGSSTPATVGTDTGAAAALEYYSASANGGAGGWLTYSSSVTLPTDGTLLVRTAIINDAPLEVSETFRLTATYNGTGGGTNGGTDTGIGTIKDDGTGDLYSASNTSGIADAIGSQADLPAALDDDRPSFSVGDVIYNEAAGTLTFTVTKSGSTTQTTTVNYATADGTALAGQDYTATSGTLTFAAGDTSKTVTVQISNDAVFELSETLNLNLSNPTNARISDSTGVGTIKDDGTGTGGTNDDRPTFAVNDVLINEAAGTMTFTVTKSGSTNLGATVNYAIANGSGSNAALSGSDYSAGTDPLGGTLTFAAGETSKTVTMAITVDSSFEDLEELVINLTGASDATISDAQGLGRILDLPTVTISDATVIEATDAYAVVTVSLSQASSLPLNFTPTLINNGSGTAFAVVGTDTQNTPSGVAIEYFNGTAWVSAAGGVTIPAGSTSVQLRSAIRMTDGIGEAIETYGISTNALSFSSGATSIVAPSVAGTVTIIDNPTMSISSVIVNEASAYAIVQVTLSLPASSPISFTPSLVSGSATAGVDASQIEYFNGTSWVSAASGVTIPSTATGILLRAAITPDTLNEVNETLSITTGPAANVLNASGVTGTITIYDQGTDPSSANNAIFTANNNTATPDALTPTISAVIDPLAVPSGQVLLDDDRPLTIDNVTVNEGSPYAVFTVGGREGQYVDLTLAAGTATSGTDYANALEYWNGSAWTTYTPGTFVKIPSDGDGTANEVANLLVRVAILQDTPMDGGETFTITAKNTGNGSVLGTGTIVDDGTGTYYAATASNTGVTVAGTNAPALAQFVTPATGAVVDPVATTAPILDNDAPLSVTNTIVSEAEPYLVWTVTGKETQYISLAAASGSATLGKDAANELEYWDGSGWVKYQPGTFVRLSGSNPAANAQLQVRMAVIDDADFEGTETLSLIATSSSGKQAFGQGQIYDDRPDLGGPIPLPASVSGAGLLPILGGGGSATYAWPLVPPSNLFVQWSVDASRQLSANMSGNIVAKSVIADALGGVEASLFEIENTDFFISKFDRVTDPNLFVLPAVRAARIDAQEAKRPAFMLQSGLLQAAGVNDTSAVRFKVTEKSFEPEMANSSLAALTLDKPEKSTPLEEFSVVASQVLPREMSQQFVHDCDFVRPTDATISKESRTTRGQSGFSKQLQLAAQRSGAAAHV